MRNIECGCQIGLTPDPHLARSERCAGVKVATNGPTVIALKDVQIQIEAAIWIGQTLGHSEDSEIIDVPNCLEEGNGGHQYILSVLGILLGG